MRPLLPCGDGFNGQTLIWSAVCSLVPQLQLGDGFKPQRDKQELKHPTPERRRFKTVQALRGRSDHGGRLLAGDIPKSARRECAVLRSTLFHSYLDSIPGPGKSGTVSPTDHLHIASFF